MDVDCRLLLRAGPRNLVTLSIQLDILPVPRVARTQEAPGSEGESEPALPPHPPLKNRAETRCGLLIRPLEKDY